MKSLGTGIVTWSYEQYRSNAEKEYDEFWQALFRELIQNSNDSGAGLINIQVCKENNTIICKDNGCGMGLDTIQNKLLVIGGSQKGSRAVGGLGKAKELLYFSQPTWEIQTLGHVIKGNGGEYEIFENTNTLSGTIVTLHQPEGSPMGSAYEAAEYVMERCQVKPKLQLNQHIIGSRHHRGPVVRDLPEIGRLHYKKTSNLKKIKSYHMDVSVNGCWMFSKWMGEYNGHAVLDIDSSRLSPMEGLTANRDNLKSVYARQLDALIQEIAIDKKSALQKREPTKTLLQGSGSIDVLPTDLEIDDMFDIFSQATKDEAEIDDAFITPDVELTVERVEMMFKLAKREGSDWTQRELIERYAHIVNYEPDFVILEDPDRDEWAHSRIKNFLPTQKSATIAKVWTETVKQVLLDNGIKTRFTAGFIFDKESEAMYSKDDGMEIYYVNPLMVPPTGIQNKVQFMNWMRTTAVHEVTHRTNRYHDEEFMAKYHDLETKTWDSHRIYARIGKLR